MAWQAALAGGVASAMGGAMQGIWSAVEAKKQRKWSEKMRRTAYQTTMNDMRKAGLNPMLAYGRGPTPHSSGAAARIPGIDLGAGAKAGGEVWLKKQQGGLLGQQTVQSAAQARKLSAEAEAVELENMGRRITNEFMRSDTGKRFRVMKEFGPWAAGIHEAERLWNHVWPDEEPPSSSKERKIPIRPPQRKSDQPRPNSQMQQHYYDMLRRHNDAERFINRR